MGKKRPKRWPDSDLRAIRAQLSGRFGNVPGVRHPERKIFAMTHFTITSSPNRNPGIVPPWLSKTEPRNPGIVPPWLQNSVHILPIEEATPIHILPVEMDGETQFVSDTSSISPMTLLDALRSR